MSHKVLVVDDEVQITRVLRRSLTAHRYEVRTASEGLSALDLFHDWNPDLVITDLSMPEMNGLELCREIRKTSKTPIIILSVRGEEQSKVEALDSGADDYITKPFGINELMARVRATLRRVPAEQQEDTSHLEEGDFQIDIAAHQVLVRKKEIHLTPKEFDLLVYLFLNRGKVITHRALLAAIWGGEYTEQTEYLRVFVGQLRKKIEEDPGRPKYLLTEPWVGYRFAAAG